MALTIGVKGSLTSFQWIRQGDFMQTTTALYKSIYSSPHHVETKLDIYSSDGETEVGSVRSNNIIEAKTSRSLFETNDFSIGCCVAGEIDIKFFPIFVSIDSVYSVREFTATIPRMAMLKLYFRLVSVDDSSVVSEWLPKGVYFVDSRQTEKSSGAITLHGFDAMLKTEDLYTDSSNTEYPISDINMVSHIATAIGVEVDSRTSDVITGEYNVGLPIGYSMREVLSGIAIPYCANFCISDEGKLLTVSAIVVEPENGILMDNVSGLAIEIGGVHIIV